jgi:hypothetical protein
MYSPRSVSTGLLKSVVEVDLFTDHGLRLGDRNRASPSSATGNIQDDFYRLTCVYCLVDNDAMCLHLGNEALQVAVKVLNHLGPHGMGALAHGRRVWQGGKCCQATLEAPFGVVVQRLL